jgi:hypothetical protein
VNARRLGAILAALTLAASGGYVFVYLYRWEWNRALVSAAIFIATEIAVTGWLLADRMRRVERRIDALATASQERRVLRLRETAPPARTGFAWLARPNGMNVFVPVLMGAGVMLSALAWVVERIARATAGPTAERGLATRLGALDLPARGFLYAGQDPLDLLHGPAGRSVR